jgi:hypothetical protein
LGNGFFLVVGVIGGVVTIRYNKAWVTCIPWIFSRMSHPWISSMITRFINSTTSPTSPASPRDPLIPLGGSPPSLSGPPLLRAHHFLVVHNFLEILHLVYPCWHPILLVVFFSFSYLDLEVHHPLKIVITKTIMEHALPK